MASARIVTGRGSLSCPVRGACNCPVYYRTRHRFPQPPFGTPGRG
jgi:hypothetical protein